MKTAERAADLMANAHQEGNPDRELGTSFVRVKDCRVWAEINYLDSPTAYREYLPLSKTPSHQAQLGPLTMLDTQRKYVSGDLARLLLLLLAILLLLMSGYLLYCVVDLLS